MKKIKLFFKSLFFIFLYFFLSLSLYMILYKHIYNESNIMLANLSTIFADLLVLFIFIVIFRKKIIPDYNDFKKNYKIYIKDNYKYWLIGLLLMIVSNILITIFISDIPTNEEINRQILLTNPLSSIISLVIVAPIIEELITRKTFRDVFNNQYIYILVSGLIFGSLHLLAAKSLSEIFYIIPYSILGCAFAKIYYNTDNLWSNIFFHSLHNFITIIYIFCITILWSV